MGTRTFDAWAIGHFVYGSICFWILDYYGFSTKQNFWINNGVHFVMELLEKNHKPDGTVLETQNNHVGDIVGFFGGWLLAKKLPYRPGNAMAFVFGVIVTLGITEEIQREIRPDQCTWLQRPGAFMA